ncbi:MULTISPECIES: helix-turn-helix domain-containing protein [Dickeya]|uniref:helix-turn-helix domain-containing protein n=1 Tax=Dickeya TaxID=204037 RepID=UPI0011A9FCD4|nr:MULTISPECIES: helix-turn-helix transcriptional regulator [Dickeya]
MSQEELSERSLESRCYISIATIKRAELGKPVSRQTLHKLAKFFDVAVDNLIMPVRERIYDNFNYNDYVNFVFSSSYKSLIPHDANKN